MIILDGISSWAQAKFKLAAKSSPSGLRTFLEATAQSGRSDPAKRTGADRNPSSSATKAPVPFPKLCLQQKRAQLPEKRAM
jgi:hypothetical protein